MIPSEVLRKIRRIQIRTQKAVNDVFSGQYESVFKGRGMEFEEVREYLPGDEVKTIDWNVTARMGHPYIKRFVEERELTVMLLADGSRSMQFGTRKSAKKDLCAELCSVLAFSAVTNNDRVGLMVFTDRRDDRRRFVPDRFIPPRKGLKHVLRVIREVLYFEPSGHGTDIPGALEYLSRVMTRRCVVFVISDFLAEGFGKALRIANKRHDIISVIVSDPVEFASVPEGGGLPPVGMITFEDLETGETFTVDSLLPEVRKDFSHITAAQRKELENSFRSAGVDQVPVSTGVSYVEPLVKFFRMREKRM